MSFEISRYAGLHWHFSSAEVVLRTFACPFHYQVSRRSTTKAQSFSQTTVVPSPMGLLSTTMEWLLLLSQSTWKRHRSDLEPVMHHKAILA